jgi:hypothetical protein
MRFRGPILALALCSAGCATAHKNAYIAASVTKQVVTESHEIWSEKLNEKATECDNSTDTSEAFDQCLGPYAKNDDVVTALEIYKNAAESLFRVLKSEDAEATAIKELRQRVIDAAWDLLDKLPDDQFKGLKNQLQSIVGK